MISTLITLVVLCAIVWISFWIVDSIPVPAPMNLIVKLIIGLVVLIKLLSMIGVY